MCRPHQQRTLDEIELTFDVASARCPHCGRANLFLGFSEILAFVCKECGESVRLSDDRASTESSARRIADALRECGLLHNENHGPALDLMQQRSAGPRDRLRPGQ